MRTAILIICLLLFSTFVPGQQSAKTDRYLQKHGGNKSGNLFTAKQLAEPVQIYPADGTAFRHFPRHTVLVWQEVPGAKSYAVEVDCFHCCKHGFWCTDVDRTWMVRPNITSTVFDFDFVGAQPGRWRVWAVGENGEESPKSEWRTFSFHR